MGIIVQKFGGSSVADNTKLFNVCKHIIREYNSKKQVVVVVSAQGKTTDQLIREALEIDKNPSQREIDMLISTGEQVTISKLAICLNKLGYQAISLTGWQVPIKTNDIANNADVEHININRILNELEQNKIVIVAGFQGINKYNDITTLGRGGSDTTAVALAAALKAERCDIYTDVDGVYNRDPRTNKNAYKFENISYDEMLKLANDGAQVLHYKCIELAARFNVPIYVKSSFEKNPIGTFVGK